MPRLHSEKHIKSRRCQEAREDILLRDTFTCLSQFHIYSIMLGCVMLTMILLSKYLKFTKWYIYINYNLVNTLPGLSGDDAIESSFILLNSELSMSPTKLQKRLFTFWQISHIHIEHSFSVLKIRGFAWNTKLAYQGVFTSMYLCNLESLVL